MSQFLLFYWKTSGILLSELRENEGLAKKQYRHPSNVFVKKTNPQIDICFLQYYRHRCLNNTSLWTGNIYFESEKSISNKAWIIWSIQRNVFLDWKVEKFLKKWQHAEWLMFQFMAWELSKEDVVLFNWFYWYLYLHKMWSNQMSASCATLQ